MRRFLAVTLTALWACCPSGCDVKYTEPTTQPAKLSPAEKDFEAVWQAARQTLRTYRFELDRQDRRAGLITTAPMTGVHFFEVWRRDAARPIDLGESTVQTIHRTARVSIRPVNADAQTYQAHVEVLLRRSDRPTPQVTSTSEAYGLFHISGSRKQRRSLLLDSGEPGQGREHFVDLGPDRALEAKLTSEIAAAAARLRGVAPAGKPRPAPKPAAPAKEAPATKPAGTSK